MAKERPIIVIKKKGGHGGHHGGAWKVAYADFVTAMMALFIVLWLLNSSEQVKKAVAGYFNDPKGTSANVGTDRDGVDESLPINKDNIQKLKEQLEKTIKEKADLKKLKDQIEIKITPEGLRIELLESDHGGFFESGSTKLSEPGQEILTLLAEQLKDIPNHISMEGHTDAQPYSVETTYGNWELSSDRANTARRLMQQRGLRPDQISQVRGYADQKLRIPSNPLDPSNRRISLIVQYQDLQENLDDSSLLKKPEGETGKSEHGEAAKHEGKASEPAKSGEAAKPPEHGKANEPAQPANKPAAGVAAPQEKKSLLNSIPFLKKK